MLPIWYNSEETGAPTLNNAAGSLIAVLDALLTTGFNVKAVTSVSVSGGVATAVISAHGYEVGKTLLIAGATPSGLNGNRVITAVVDANTVRWAAVGVPDGAASGSITAKRAPLGWVKAFAGTNKAIYQRTDPQATPMLWRVDDTAAGVASATYARSRMVESATDVDTVMGPAPLEASLAGGCYISKGVNSAASKQWMAVGDGRTLWFFSDDTGYPIASNGGLHGAGFGDVNSIRSTGDAYGCMVWGGSSNSGINQTHFSTESPTAAGGIYLSRPTNHIGGAVAASFKGRASGQYVGAVVAQHAPYPSPVDGGMVVETSVLVAEFAASGGNLWRGTARGLAHPLGNVGTQLHGTVLNNLQGSDDSLLCIAVAAQGSGGTLMFNVSSEW